ncbi:hypothetical protein BRETT_004064 [Brettanomyces bruxellensis]|uniref:NAD(P)-binding domain-containing protein n=1 Tax=Dekkera bruxellensis TaxID=5007 RepID=A0A871R1A9_DEKBR|nr:uncharacterized protein BRETT_004064 [Brettanomyces bruxellensis]QOU18846.1 hypothetical protein BRETT_004064 [Brettanomyces bruxellensis]
MDQQVKPLRSVLVTGGAGFIGSNFLRYVCRSPRFAYFHFTCLDKLSYVSEESTKFIEDLMKLPNFDFIRADLSSEYRVLERLIVEEEKFTDFINFAAESSVDRSYEEPLFFTRNNIFATQNLLECVRLLMAKNDFNRHITFIHISTDEVYGDQQSGEAVDEQSRLEPTNPYSATKAAIDLIINAYVKSFHLPILVVRSNNVYGYNQYPEKLIPMTINALKEDKPITIHGDGHQRRRYVFIDDFIRAVLCIWEVGDQHEIYNVGSDQEICNLKLVRMIRSLYELITGSKSNSEIKFVGDRLYNDERYDVTYEKLCTLGWKPTINLEEGLVKIIRYTLKH